VALDDARSATLPFFGLPRCFFFFLLFSAFTVPPVYSCCKHNVSSSAGFFGYCFRGLFANAPLDPLFSGDLPAGGCRRACHAARPRVLQALFSGAAISLATRSSVLDRSVRAARRCACITRRHRCLLSSFGSVQNKQEKRGEEDGGHLRTTVT